MKKMNVVEMMALLSLLCVLAGCPTDDEGDDPEKMTFAGDDKEFTIDENLGFNVHFTEPYTKELSGISVAIKKGERVWGTIKSDNSWTDNEIEGEIKGFGSNNAAVNIGAGVANGMQIKLTYTKDTNDNDKITEITVAFVEPENYDDLKDIADLAILGRTVAYLGGISQLGLEVQSNPTDTTKALQYVQALIQGGFLAQTDATDKDKIIEAAQKVGTELATALVEGGQLQQTDAQDSEKIGAAAQKVGTDLVTALGEGGYLGENEQPSQEEIAAAAGQITTQVMLFELCDDIVGGTYDRQ